MGVSGQLKLNYESIIIKLMYSLNKVKLYKSWNIFGYFIKKKKKNSLTLFLLEVHLHNLTLTKVHTSLIKVFT